MSFKLTAATLFGAVGIAACCLSGAHADTMAGDMSARSADERLDYSKLYNSTYDYADLKYAKALGYSDDTVAGMLKLARGGRMPFRYVYNLVASGHSFLVIADKLGVSPGSLKNVQAEKDEIAAYLSAYEATGKMGARRQSLAKLETEAAKAARK